MDSSEINKKYDLGVLKLLKIWKNYYLDASSVYYALKKAHTKADGGVEYDICTYHARLEEALAEAVRRTIREGVASGELKEWERGAGAAAVHLSGGQGFDLNSEEQQMCMKKEN